MSEDTHNAISSPESAAGPLPCTFPAGGQTDLFGQEAALANHSALPEKAKAPMTFATCGQSSGDLSHSVTLQLSLENRLRQRMAAYGSMEYELTWKRWDMTLEPPICALRASQRRISDKDFFGWPTPAVQNATGGPNPAGNAGDGFFTLQTAAAMAGWPNPNTMDSIDRKGLRPSRIATGRTGGYIAEVLAGWVTPSARDYKDTPGMSMTGTNPDGSQRVRLDQLPRQAAIAGRTTLLFPVETEKRGVLNPELSRWLMGYPEEWEKYAPTETL